MVAYVDRSMRTQKKNQLVKKTLLLIATHSTKPPAVAPWSKSQPDRYLRNATRRSA